VCERGSHRSSSLLKLLLIEHRHSQSVIGSQNVTWWFAWLETMVKKSFISRRTSASFEMKSTNTKRLLEQENSSSIDAGDARHGTLRGMIAAGLGIALLPRSPLRMDGIVEVRLSQPGAVRPLGIGWIEERYLPPCAAAFRSFVSSSGVRASNRTSK
jgi:DNA-binding transcriptional LysR family regulator